MTTAAAQPLWQRVREPRGPVARTLRRAGTSALGTYAAYLAYGLRHPRLLRRSVTPEERRAPLPGDELVPDAHWTTDFGVDVDATPPEVWPWLLQIGYGRAGYYTWYPLDNGGVPSPDAIVPRLQQLAVGDLVPDGPRAAEGFGVWRVRALEAPRALVLHSRRNLLTGHEVAPDGAGDESFVDCSWAFVLTESAPGRSRLRVRVRARVHGGRWAAPLARAAALLFELGDNVMENTMLDGIRRRAERHRK